jgi:hypothetical protein
MPSSWKVLFLLLGLTISKHNASILLIKLSFLFDYLRFDRQNIKGILVTSLWTYTAALDHNFGGNIALRQKVINTLFLISMAICINE